MANVGRDFCRLGLYVDHGTQSSEILENWQAGLTQGHL